MKKRMQVIRVRSMCIFVLALCLWSGICREGMGSDKYPVHEPKWTCRPLQVDLTKYFPNGCILEFSADSKYLCAYNRDESPKGVFDTSGTLVASTGDPSRGLPREFVPLFARSVPRSSGYLYWDQYMTQSGRGIVEDLGSQLRVDNFILDTGGWAFDKDFKTGFRLINPRPSGEFADRGAHESPASRENIWSAELWSLEGMKHRIWAVDLPSQYGASRWVGFFERNGELLVLVAFGEEAHSLSGKDGRIVDSFTYGNLNLLSPRNPRENLFLMGTFDLDPQRRLLVCAVSSGRMVHVVSVDPPYPVVFELNASHFPASPPNGLWDASRVEFMGNGLLLIDYDFGGRLPYSLLETCIFDTKSWERVWSKTSKFTPFSPTYMTSVEISPDRRWLAYTKGNILFLGPFAGIPSPPLAVAKKK